MQETMHETVGLWAGVATVHPLAMHETAPLWRQPRLLQEQPYYQQPWYFHEQRGRREGAWAARNRTPESTPRQARPVRRRGALGGALIAGAAMGLFLAFVVPRILQALFHTAS